MTPDEALDRAHEALLARGRVDLSLREIGRITGVSARMLVYYFGSREQLLVAVLERERQRQAEWLEVLIGAGHRPSELLRTYFHEMTEPAHRNRLRFFFDLVAEAGRAPEVYGRFLSRDLVGYWQTAMADYTRRSGGGELDPRWAALALAAGRGLYLDVLATGDTGGVRRTFDLLLDCFERARGAANSDAAAPRAAAGRVRVRGWREAEWAALAAIYTAGRRAAFPWVDPDHFSDEQFAADSAGETILVAVDAADRPLGFVAIWQPQSFIHHLYVQPDHRRRGIGSALLERAATVCADPPWLKVTERNTPAIAFYEAHGWRALGHRGTDALTGAWVAMAAPGRNAT